MRTVKLYQPNKNNKNLIFNNTQIIKSLARLLYFVLYLGRNTTPGKPTLLCYTISLKHRARKGKPKQTNKARWQTGNFRIPTRLKTTLVFFQKSNSLKNTEDECTPLYLLLVSVLHRGIYSEHILTFTEGERRRGQ